MSCSSITSGEIGISTGIRVKRHRDAPRDAVWWRCSLTSRSFPDQTRIESGFYPCVENIFGGQRARDMVEWFSGQMVVCFSDSDSSLPDSLVILDSLIV